MKELQKMLGRKIDSGFARMGEDSLAMMSEIYGGQTGGSSCGATGSSCGCDGTCMCNCRPPIERPADPPEAVEVILTKPGGFDAQDTIAAAATEFFR